MILFSASKTLSLNHDEKLELKMTDKQKILLAEIQKNSKETLGKNLKIKGDVLSNTYKMYQQFGKIKAYSIDMYSGLAFRQIENPKKKYLKTNVFIISAFYGIINAHCPISRYRLDFTNNKFSDKTLYSYWKEEIVEAINSNKSKQILNLCSNEYFNAVDTSKINKKIYHLQTKSKVPSATLKKIRGEILNYCIENNIKNYRRLNGIQTKSSHIYKLENNILYFKHH